MLYQQLYSLYVDSLPLVVYVYTLIVQVEVVHDAPEILLFHNIVSEPELDQIKQLAQPMVSIFQTHQLVRN